ncbi:ABC transporter, partial [Bifidobacteriaceae bacterium WP012]
MSNIFNTNIDNSIDSDETKSSTSVDSATSATPVTDSANAKANPEPSIVANLRWRVADIALGAALSAVFGVILCGYGLVFIP